LENRYGWQIQFLPSTDGKKRNRHYCEHIEALRAALNMNIRTDFVPIDKTKLLVWDLSFKNQGTKNQIISDGEAKTEEISRKISRVHQNYSPACFNKLKLSNRNLPALKGAQNNFMIGSFTNTINDN
jgi:hypothetical protein